MINDIEPNPVVEANNARFEARLDITAKSEAEFVRFAVHFLRNRGYDVSEPNAKWETPKEFNSRLNLCPHGLSRALNRYKHPICSVHRTPTGRIREVLSNHAFDEYCRKNCK